MADAFRLDGRTALVTGGSRGIGRAVATELVSRGADVVVCGRDADAGQAAAAEVGARFVRADVTDEQDVRALVRQCPDLSVLVNNAGPTDLLHTRDVDGPVGVVSLANFEKVLSRTLTAAFLPTHHVLPVMTARGGGTVVNVSSIAAAAAMPGFDAYSAGKGALEALTRSTAVGYAHLGVRCNAVRVGTIAVDHGDGGRRRLVADDGNPEAWRRADPPAAGSPEDVAHAVVFLASDASAYVNGVVLNVDGGMLARSAMPWQTERPQA